MFEFYGDNVKVGPAYIFQRMRGQGRSPEGASGSGFGREAAAVQEHLPVTIAADEIAPTEQVIRARPFVCATGRSGRGGHACRAREPSHFRRAACDSGVRPPRRPGPLHVAGNRA